MKSVLGGSLSGITMNTLKNGWNARAFGRNARAFGRNWLKKKPENAMIYNIMFLFIEGDYYNREKQVDQKITDIDCGVSLDDGNNNESLNTRKQET